MTEVKAGKKAAELDAKNPKFVKRAEGMRALLSVIRQQEETIRLGGGAKAIQSQHDKGRLTVRERVSLLIDPDTTFRELGLFAAFEMYGEWGGAPAADVESRWTHRGGPRFAAWRYWPGTETWPQCVSPASLHTPADCGRSQGRADRGRLPSSTTRTRRRP